MSEDPTFRDILIEVRNDVKWVKRDRERADMECIRRAESNSARIDSLESTRDTQAGTFNALKWAVGAAWTILVFLAGLLGFHLNERGGH